jgi:hypothetical protein
LNFSGLSSLYFFCCAFADIAHNKEEFKP